MKWAEDPYYHYHGGLSTERRTLASSGLSGSVSACSTLRSRLFIFFPAFHTEAIAGGVRKGDRRLLLMYTTTTWRKRRRGRGQKHQTHATNRGGRTATATSSLHSAEAGFKSKHSPRGKRSACALNSIS